MDKPPRRTSVEEHLARARAARAVMDRAAEKVVSSLRAAAESLRRETERHEPGRRSP